MKILIDPKKYSKSEDILFDLEKDLDKIEAIGIIDGQGSFTGIRIAATIANAVGYVKNIPLYQFKEGEEINWDKKPVKMINPDYGKKPNITKSKNKKNNL